MAAAPLHPLLLRQLRKTGVETGRGADADTLTRLLQRVDQAYLETDQDRYLMERSQDVASREMATLNQALSASQSRLASLLSLSSDWAWEQDEDGRFCSVSGDLLQRTGVPAEALIGKCLAIDGPVRMAPEELDRLQAHQARCETFRHLTCETVAADGSTRHLRISGEPVFQDTRLLGWRGVGSDVTAQVLAERKVLELARYDSLTGLPNRHLVMEELARALARATRSGAGFGLFFIDLDRFKFVNDNLGHAAGDELLRCMAQRLRAVLREVDMLGRLGGDEFVVLTEHPCDTSHLSRLATRLLAAAAEPVTLGGRSVQISASVGISIYPADGDDCAMLLRHADAAMYQAKLDGKNAFAFFKASLAHSARRRFALEGELRLALQRREFVLHYQPQVCAESGALVGFEALVRWQHPQRGLLAPLEFIALAEETGLIVGLGRWVLFEACRQLAAWRGAGLAPPPCAINVSARQLGDDSLPADVQAALGEAGLEAAALQIEVTESALMADPARASRLLAALRQMGVGVAIDDFGTGFSSLSSLKGYSASTLKVDRSFVRGLPDDGDDLAITRAVVALGRSLGLCVVAEGVETRAQQDCLRGLGCDVLQGYLFGRPMPAAEAAGRLARPGPSLG